MRVLVCGGRDYDDAQAVYRELDALRAKHGRLVVIQGCAPGADALAREWIERFGAENDELLNFPAAWASHGKAAGPIRNRHMLYTGKPDIVLAFPGGRGTANMVKQAREFGVPVIEFISLEATASTPALSDSPSPS